MIVRFEEIPEISSKKVRFYSVKLGPDPVTEFEKFDNKKFTDPNHKEELQIIYTTIWQIIARGKAHSSVFREERQAVALPGKSRELKTKKSPDFGLRLYAIHVDEKHVVLLNGGIKTKLNPEECPNVKQHFTRAVKLAPKLMKAVEEGFIRFTENGIETDDGFEIDI